MTPASPAAAADTSGAFGRGTVSCLPSRRRWVDRVVDFASPERILRYGILMLAVTLGGGAIQAALGPGLLDSFGHVVGVDFMAFFTGGRFLLEGHVAELYSLEAQRAFQISVTAPHVLKGMHPFINPPYATLIYAPFAYWPYPVGLTLWWLTGLCALAGCVGLLRGELDSLRRYRARTVLGASFLFFPTVSWVLYGQISPVTLLLYTATFVFLRRGRDFAAGVSLGCLAYKPQLAMTMAIVILFKRRSRAAYGGMLAAGAWIAIGFLLTPGAMIRYVKIAPGILSFLRWEEYPRWGVHSLMGFSSLLLDDLSHEIAGWAAMLLSAGTLGMVLWHWRSTPWAPGSRSWDLGMAGTFALGLLISPHLFVYDLMLLLLPFALVVHHLPRTGSRPLDRGPMLAWSVLLWITTFLGSYASLAQLELTRGSGLPAMALQVSTLVVFVWGWSVLRLGALPSAPRSVDRPGSPA